MTGTQSVFVISRLNAPGVVVSKTRVALHKRAAKDPTRCFFPSKATDATLSAFSKPTMVLLNKDCLYYGGILGPCVSFAV